MLRKTAGMAAILFCLTAVSGNEPDAPAGYGIHTPRNPSAESTEDREGSPEKYGEKQNRWKKLGQSTLVFAPSEFALEEPEQLTFRLEGVRMDAYSRGFAQGDAIYIEIIRPNKVFGFYSYLYDEDGNRLPLTQTTWGYRLLLPIGAQDKREKIVLTWKQSVSDRFGTAKIEIPVNEKSFPQTRWYNRVSSLFPIGPANAGGGGSDANSGDSTSKKEGADEVASLEDRKETRASDTEQESETKASGQDGEEKTRSNQESEAEKEHAGEEESEQRLSNFMKKITLEKSLKNQVFERKGNDLITNRLSHPRDMHYITSQCFTSRLQIYYKYENGKKVEVNRRVVMHNGVDLRGRPGTPVYAIADGQVVMARSMHFEGNFTVIDHGLGVFSGYMHQSNLRVQVGQYVRAGERIGDVGNTGYSTGPHLHLALWIRGVPVDPLSLYSLPIRE